MSETPPVPTQGQVIALPDDPRPTWRVRTLSTHPALGVTVAILEHLDDPTQTRHMVYRTRQRP